MVSRSSESVADRVRRFPRAASVAARTRMAEAAAFEAESPSVETRPAPSTSRRERVTPAAVCRYFLRSMRRQE